MLGAIQRISLFVLTRRTQKTVITGLKAFGYDGSRDTAAPSTHLLAIGRTVYDAYHTCTTIAQFVERSGCEGSAAARYQIEDLPELSDGAGQGSSGGQSPGATVEPGGQSPAGDGSVSKAGPGATSIGCCWITVPGWEITGAA